MREGNFNFKLYLLAADSCVENLQAPSRYISRTDELCCTPLRVFQHTAGVMTGHNSHTHTRSLARTTTTEGESETQSVVVVYRWLADLPVRTSLGLVFLFAVLCCVSNTPRRRRRRPCTTLLLLLTAHEEGLSLPPGPIPRESHGTQTHASGFDHSGHFRKRLRGEKRQFPEA